MPNGAQWQQQDMFSGSQTTQVTGSPQGHTRASFTPSPLFTLPLPNQTDPSPTQPEIPPLRLPFLGLKHCVLEAAQEGTHWNPNPS